MNYKKNSSRSRIEVRLIALLRYHDRTRWTSASDLDL